MHTSDVNINSKNGTFHAKAEDSNMYKTLDLCMHKIERQLAKKSEQLKAH
jgi:ribosomal subunit interface protein